MNITIYTGEGIQVFKGNAKELYGFDHRDTVRKNLVKRYSNTKVLYIKEIYEIIQPLGTRWSVIDQYGSMTRIAEQNLPSAIKAVELIDTN